MRHDHVANGVFPVKGCDVCARIVERNRINDEKRPEGRLPPWWHWDQDDMEEK
jgi:hypothetical protein